MRIKPTALFAAFALMAFAAAAPAQTPQQARQTYNEGRSSAAAQGAYFYAYLRREDPRVSVIIAFPEAANRLDGASALWITQSIDCSTRQIRTDRYEAYGEDGALLHQRQNIPADIAPTLGADIWARRLNENCDPPTPLPFIPVAVDPPPAYDRRFADARVTSAAEAIAVMRARAEARAQATSLSREGRWGTYIGQRLSGGSYIDYAASDATHMSYLFVGGVYEEDWSYGRARYVIDCTARTAFAEYVVHYTADGSVVSIGGPTASAPTSMMLARQAISAYCASPTPRGRTYDALPQALEALRAENDLH